MHVIELQCPHCSTRLRLRDQKFIGRTIHCPDCTQPVSIVRTAAGVIQASATAPSDSLRAADSKESVPSPSGEFSTPTSSAAVVRPTVNPPKWLTPPRVAWGLASLLTLGLALFVFLGAPSPPPAPTVPAVAETPAPPAAERELNPPDQPAASVPPQGPQSLAEWVIAYRDRQGHYPIESPLTLAQPEGERLGWLASVAASREPSGPQPHWDRPWRDPLNGRFVRRRMETFLDANGPAAADGFPATHYVGISGVGVDAGRLEKSHPRAGVFGINRATTVEDVRDGLANTLLIMGVVPRPSPWAAGGESTIRSLTAEPYVNGPDGFGTGQADGMWVAMADGGVRFLSTEIDPRVLRRMAAMADGLPLDPMIPGEPGDSRQTPELALPTEHRPARPAAPLETLPAGNGLAATESEIERPIEPRLAPERRLPEPVTYDVETALAQPIASFSQRRAIPLKRLLRDLEDLAGVPINSDQLATIPGTAVLDREVTLQVDKTTVGDILTQLLNKVGLRYVADRAIGIQLLPATTTTPRADSSERGSTSSGTD